MSLIPDFMEISVRTSARPRQIRVTASRRSKDDRDHVIDPSAVRHAICGLTFDMWRIKRRMHCSVTIVSEDEPQQKGTDVDSLMLRHP
jgi:hypothetical protein